MHTYLDSYRKNIRESLTNERERLLTELDDFLGRVQSELETFDPNNLPAGRGRREGTDGNPRARWPVGRRAPAFF